MNFIKKSHVVALLLFMAPTIHCMNKKGVKTSWEGLFNVVFEAINHNYKTNASFETCRKWAIDQAIKKNAIEGKATLKEIEKVLKNKEKEGLDQETLAQKCKRLVREKLDREKIAQKCKRLVREKLDREKIAQKCKRITKEGSWLSDQRIEIQKHQKKVKALEKKVAVKFKGKASDMIFFHFHFDPKDKRDYDEPFLPVKVLYHGGEDKGVLAAVSYDMFHHSTKIKKSRKP